MSKLGTTAFRGTAGHKYEFSIFSLDAHFKAGHGGVYVVTRRKDEPHSHHSIHVIFIGETSDFSTDLADHPNQADFEKEEANSICIHPTQEPKARERICRELREHYGKVSGDTTE